MRAAAAVALVALLQAQDAAAMTLKIGGRTEECMDLVAEQEQPLNFFFRVTAGGELDVDVKITGPGGQELRRWEKQTEGRHNWHAAAAGTYTVCLSNMMARWTPKWVNFNFVAGHSPHTARLEHLDPIEKTIIQLTEGLAELQEEQKELRAVERVHRDTIESTNERILWWSVFEAVALCAVGLCQMYYLKRFLEVKASY
eukprot:TRINITY_DN29955_c0_g1_i1.p2 TRINITY_DN29955_c0_g1~~TRINITY_DN29955_c0_g1_i1.p2  ORF type:complete len:199 (+),score=82.67 TRINITY_DN29955_c0_g1_i1:63-659(+)